MGKSNKQLSASRIKTLENCSWLYWCNYHLKLPDTTNTGALRGTLCHAVFEWLLLTKHRKHFDDIVNANDIKGSPAIERVVVAYLKKYDLPDPEDYKLVNKMILVGLTTDFFLSGKKLFDPEYAFNIRNKKPVYNARGFIDKWALDEKNKTVHICDYKSSKSKFSGDELASNVQAMLYSLAAKKVHPEYAPIVTFIFLRFKKAPEQVLQFDEKTLEGFEHYLEMCQAKIDDFSHDDATDNYAADQPQKGGGFNGILLCGFCKEKGELKKDGNPKWSCAYKFPYDYYALIDNRGVCKKTAVTNIAEEYKDNQPTILKELKKGKKGWKIEKRHYGGCPKWNKTSLTSF
jgi:hypothetical protein